jgi:hypothetical protein
VPSNIEELYDSVYTAGKYHELFRIGIQKITDERAAQLQIGRSVYDTMVLVGKHGKHIETLQQKPNDLDSAPYLANEHAIISLVKPFVELGATQLQRICEQHSDDLARWLTQPSLDTDDKDTNLPVPRYAGRESGGQSLRMAMPGSSVGVGSRSSDGRSGGFLTPTRNGASSSSGYNFSVSFLRCAAAPLRYNHPPLI